MVVITPQQKIDVIKDDPKDNIFVECALEGNCKYIVSGDQHLQRLKEYEKIEILEPGKFIELCK